jgi:hypothetical protein
MEKRKQWSAPSFNRLMHGGIICSCFRLTDNDNVICRAFLCWDEPAVKATFSVTLIIPDHLTAVSNMPELSTTHLNGHKKKVLFHTTPKMSTYLLAWAVGEFDSVQGLTKSGVTVRVLCPPGRAEQGRYALDVGIRSLDFYNDYFQVDCSSPVVCELHYHLSSDSFPSAQTGHAVCH